MSESGGSDCSFFDIPRNRGVEAVVVVEEEEEEESQQSCSFFDRIFKRNNVEEQCNRQSREVSPSGAMPLNEASHNRDAFKDIPPNVVVEEELFDNQLGEVFPFVWYPDLPFRAVSQQYSDSGYGTQIVENDNRIHNRPASPREIIIYHPSTPSVPDENDRAMSPNMFGPEDYEPII